MIAGTTTPEAQKAFNPASPAEWHLSRSGKVNIAIRDESGPRGTRWSVWGIKVGTHDMAPISKYFATEAEARSYANKCWRTA